MIKRPGKPNSALFITHMHYYRPILDGRKHTDQGCLELFRFLHNVRPFQRGKRAGKSPAQLANLDVPDDSLTLLGLT